MVNILIVTGDAGEALEIWYPYQRLKEESFNVQIAAPTKKVIQSVIHDFEPGFDTYTEKRGYRIPADLSFKEVKPEKYDGLVIPGGRAPEYIRTDENLAKIVRHFLNRKKPVAVICHGSLVLIAIGAVKGRTLTAYPVLKYDIKSAGGKFVDKEVVVDKNIVTSRAWPDHPAFMREFIKLLKKKR
ncbi:MAG: DJ-1/PfpI family protein [Candidatus Bathyarchaeota archaeon]